MHPLKRLNGQALVLAGPRTRTTAQVAEEWLPQVHERICGRVWGQDDARPEDDTSWRKTLAGWTGERSLCVNTATDRMGCFLVGDVGRAAYRFVRRSWSMLAGGRVLMGERVVGGIWIAFGRR